MKNPSGTIAVSALALIAALIVVGIDSGGIVRHILQTLPVWAAVILGLRNSTLTKWAALPVFLFWLVLMTLIWLYVLGLSTIANGTYNAVELSMTFIVALAAITGIAAAIFAPGGARPGAAAMLFIAIAAVQIGLMAVSLKPPISSDAALIAWFRGR